VNFAQDCGAQWMRRESRGFTVAYQNIRRHRDADLWETLLLGPYQLRLSLRQAAQKPEQDGCGLEKSDANFETF
jgi:hypothetical protein